MAEWQRRNDPDETEGRSLYRARADAVVRMQDSMARHTAKLRMTEKAMSTCMSPRP